jgi:hypothetical protein
VRWKDMPVRRADNSFATESSGDEGDLVGVIYGTASRWRLNQTW